MNTNYLFTSKRLGFRNWRNTDLKAMSTINADKDVMEFFPDIQSTQQTSLFIERMQIEFEELGFCYFAVDNLKNKEFIGFIGIHQQEFEASFTPCIDIGWRLKKSAWNNGYATEGARKCLDYAFNVLCIENIKSMCSITNVKSEKIMQKIGMKKELLFEHPALINNKKLKSCILYQIKKPE